MRRGGGATGGGCGRPYLTRRGRVSLRGGLAGSACSAGGNRGFTRIDTDCSRRVRAPRTRALGERSFPYLGRHPEEPFAALRVNSATRDLPSVHRGRPRGRE